MAPLRTHLLQARRINTLTVKIEIMTWSMRLGEAKNRAHAKAETIQGHRGIVHEKAARLGKPLREAMACVTHRPQQQSSKTPTNLGIIKAAKAVYHLRHLARQHTMQVGATVSKTAARVLKALQASKSS